MRKITFMLQVIEEVDGKETVIYEHRPASWCHNRGHLFNLMLIAIQNIRAKFSKKEL
jgi:hypothetical protein